MPPENLTISSPSRRLPRTFWYLWAGMLLNRLGGFLYLILANYLKTKQFSDKHIGFLMALYGIGALMAGPCGGFLADRIGRRKTMIFSTFTGALSMVHLGLAQTPVHIFIAAWLLGFLGSLYRPASQAAVADVVEPVDRAKAYGWMYWASNLGFAGAAAISGLLRNAKIPYLYLFVIDAAAMALFGMLIVFTVSETKAIVSTQDPFSKAEKGTWAPYVNGMFVAFLFAQFLVEMLYHQADTALPLDLNHQRFPDYFFNRLVMINGILICLVQPFAVRILPSFPRRYVLALGALLVGLGFCLPSLHKGIWMYACSIVIWTLGEIAVSSVIPLFINEVSPPQLRGSYQGAYQLTWSAAFCVSPLLGTFVLDRFGRQTLWVGCLALGSIAAAIHFIVSKRHEKRKMAVAN